MIVTLQSGSYPDFVGRRMIFAGTGINLPTSYSRGTGDVVSLANPRLYIDVLYGGIQNTDGTYTLYARPSQTGSRASWSYHWYITSAGTEVANGTNLSGINVEVGGLCGQF